MNIINSVNAQNSSDAMSDITEERARGTKRKGERLEKEEGREKEKDSSQIDFYEFFAPMDLSDDDIKPELSKRKIDLGLPPDILGIVAECFLFREAVAIFKTLDLPVDSCLKGCAQMPASMADVVSSFTQIWRQRLQVKKENQELFQEYYSALGSNENQTRFLEALANPCDAESNQSEDLLVNILKALPQDLPSLSLRPFYHCVNEDHIKLITERFTALENLEIFGHEQLTEAAFPRHPNMLKWRRLKINLELDYNWSGVTDEALRYLFTEEYLCNLEELELNCDLSASALSPIPKCTSLKKLRHLKIRSTNLPKLLGKEGLALIGKSPCLNRLETLSVSCGNLDETAMTEILESPHMTQIKQLTLRWILEVTMKAAASLANSRCITQLQVLDLSGSNLNDDALALIAKSPNMRFLMHLNLSYNRELTNAGIASIANSPYMSHLELLDIGDRTYFGDAAWISLAKSPYIKKIRRLITSSEGGIGNQALIALANSSNMSHLECLSLRGYCLISKTGIEALFCSPFITHLRTLEIEEKEFKGEFAWIDEFMCMAAKTATLQHLQILKLAHSKFLSDQSIKAIANSPYMENLHTLKINSCEKITDASAASIAGSQYLKNLKTLEFRSFCWITNRGVASIAESPNMNRLESLSLVGLRDIDDQAAVSLANSPHMAQLRKLYFWNNYEISDRAIEAIAQSPYLTRLNYLTAIGSCRVRYKRFSEVFRLENTPQIHLCKLVRELESFEPAEEST